MPKLAPFNVKTFLICQHVLMFQWKCSLPLLVFASIISIIESCFPMDRLDFSIYCYPFTIKIKIGKLIGIGKKERSTRCLRCSSQMPIFGPCNETLRMECGRNEWPKVRVLAEMKNHANEFRSKMASGRKANQTRWSVGLDVEMHSRISLKSPSSPQCWK